MTKPRVRIYARVSSLRQAQDGTIANQVSSTVLRQIKQIGEPSGEYTDDGKSASKGKLHLRGDFQRMLVDAAKGDFDILWVADLDRVTRSNDWGELGQIFGPLQRAGIKLAGPNMAPMELGSTLNQVQIMMRVAIAYEDNEKRKFRFNEGKLRSAQNGGLPEGPAPYGFAWQKGYVPRATDPRPSPGWSIHPVHGELVREMFARIVAGESAKTIARDFEERKIPGPQVNEKHPMGGRWSTAMVRIIRSTAARGEWSKLGVPIQLPRLVSDETWYAAQVALSRNKRSPLYRTRAIYLAETIGACVCGAPLRITGNTHRDGSKTRYYTCALHMSSRPVTSTYCDNESLRVEKVDALIWKEIQGFLSQRREVILRKLDLHRASATGEVTTWRDDVKRYTDMLKAQAEAEGVIMDSLMDGTLSKGAYQEKVRSFAVRRQKLQEQLNTAQAAVDQASASTRTSDAMVQQVDQFRALAESQSQEERQKLVRLMCPAGFITISKEHVVTVKVRFDGAEGSMERVVTLRAVA